MSEVTFKFSYDAFMKIGLALLAKRNMQVKNNVGHHIKIIKAISRILGDRDMEVIGNVMRRQRNDELYEGITLITNKEAQAVL